MVLGSPKRSHPPPDSGSSVILLVGAGLSGVCIDWSVYRDSQLEHWLESRPKPPSCCPWLALWRWW